MFSLPYFLLACLGVGAATQTVPAAALPAGRTLAEIARFGVYVHGLPYETEALHALESRDKLGAEVEIASGFVDFRYVFGGANDLALADHGRRTLLYSWEPSCQNPDECVAFADIVRGHADAYLERIADSMRAFPYAIYVRPWGEMNAWWSPYQPGSGKPAAGTVDEFKRAWRYLHQFFASRGVTNLKLVFNPDVSDDPNNVPLAALWPGEDAVDVLGLDGYNWGESGIDDGHHWTEFEAVFAAAYAAITRLHPSAPVWICEFGSKEPRVSDGTVRSPAPRDAAHSKAAWLRNMLQSTAFPRIEALAYYSSYRPGFDNERDFRLDSSKDSLRVIRELLRARGRATSRRERGGSGK